MAGFGSGSATFSGKPPGFDSAVLTGPASFASTGTIGFGTISVGFQSAGAKMPITAAVESGQDGAWSKTADFVGTHKF
jgi:hypothetical protein